MASNSPFPWPISRDIHIIALVPASLSFITTAIGSYWFFALINAERNFRRTLVLLLILADCSKSFWVTVFNAAGLATGDRIDSRSAFCQVGGFFLQFSFEACDIAIVCLITHVSLQILPPICFGRSTDGLWPIRYWILSIMLLVPLIDAAIPFSRMPARPAYSYDGIYCSLVSGPLWLTLLLSWVPRYIFWFYLLIMLLRLYFYIRSQSYTQARNSMPSNRSDSVVIPRSNDTEGINSLEAGKFEQQSDQLQTHQMNRTRGSVGSVDSRGSGTTRPRTKFRAVSLYPLFYILAWAVPFTAQVVSFSNSRGINGVYPLRAAAIFCISLLGIVDVTIFCSMEKPWRHGVSICNMRVIPQRSGAGRTASGDTPDERDAPIAEVQSIISSRRIHTGGSDHNRRIALLAHQRLAFEQQERAARPRAQRSTPSQDLSFAFALRCPPVLAEIPSDEE